MRLLNDRVSVVLLVLSWLSLLWAPCYADSPLDGLRSMLTGIMNLKHRPSTTIPTPRAEQWWQEMHQKNLERTGQERGKTGLLFLGDSITQNMDGSHDLMEKNWGKYGPVNLGIGGDQTEHLIWRLENGEVDGLKPHVAVILIGTNNLGVNTDSEIEDGIRAVVAAARLKMPQTKILLLGILPRTQPAQTHDRFRIKNINSQIARLADHRHVWYFDAGPSLLEPDGTISEQVMSDFLHPTHKGYDMLFTAIKPEVDQLLR